MKKLFSTIMVLGLLLSGNAYANKEIIKYGVTQVNIKTGELYEGERATYGFALDDAIKLCRKDTGSRKFCKTWSTTHFYSDGTYEVKNDLNQKDSILRDKVLTRKTKIVEEKILRAEKFDNKDQQFYYVCKEQLNLKKGTKKFNDCVFKIMTMELELAKINAEKEIAIAKAETARTKQKLTEEATAKAIAKANSQKFENNITNLLLGLLVLGEINQASQQATNFRRTFTCTPTGFASGLQYTVNCY